ncbi:hypothetical protein [Haloechinothrix sp. LS1_15]|uniref:hypothetical protein n=1 Tax=Haloechinothrix sp. LS1_15 TaxID=2652248 RepID=UPI00294491F4|nr:hypothetical protein [Haloechinothrix sp. LS1_15]MDV6013742.1 hypothetical protein [Haloechinothrix sp. LS1_15]
MVDKLTIRDVDERDLAILKAAAKDQGTSLNRYVSNVLHEQALREHHRRLFAAVAEQERDIEPFDSAAEVRSMRDEKDADDAATSSHA